MRITSADLPKAIDNHLMQEGYLRKVQAIFSSVADGD